MQTVYDKNGKAYVRDGVDCKEYLATGRYFSEPPKKPTPKKPAPVETPVLTPKPAIAKKLNKTAALSEKK